MKPSSPSAQTNGKGGNRNVNFTWRRFWSWCSANRQQDLSGVFKLLWILSCCRNWGANRVTPFPPLDETGVPLSFLLGETGVPSTPCLMKQGTRPLLLPWIKQEYTYPGVPIGWNRVSYPLRWNMVPTNSPLNETGDLLPLVWWNRYPLNNRILSADCVHVPVPSRSLGLTNRPLTLDRTDWPTDDALVWTSCE